LSGICNELFEAGLRQSAAPSRGWLRRLEIAPHLAPKITDLSAAAARAARDVADAAGDIGLHWLLRRPRVYSRRPIRVRSRTADYLIALRAARTWWFVAGPRSPKQRISCLCQSDQLWIRPGGFPQVCRNRARRRSLPRAAALPNQFPNTAPGASAHRRAECPISTAHDVKAQSADRNTVPR